MEKSWNLKKKKNNQGKIMEFVKFMKPPVARKLAVGHTLCVWQ